MTMNIQPKPNIQVSIKIEPALIIATFLRCMRAQQLDADVATVSLLVFHKGTPWYQVEHKTEKREGPETCTSWRCMMTEQSTLTSHPPKPSPHTHAVPWLCKNTDNATTATAQTTIQERA